VPELSITEGVARDKTEDWLLPEAVRPRSFAELESRVEYAVALAHHSEAAIVEVGASAVEAAEQARRAAELAENAARAAASATAVAATPDPRPSGNPALFPLPADADLQLAHFMARADHVVERLRALERMPS
jgi:hypothetical protein